PSIILAKLSASSLNCSASSPIFLTVGQNPVSSEAAYIERPVVPPSRAAQSVRPILSKVDIRNLPRCRNPSVSSICFKIGCVLLGDVLQFKFLSDVSQKGKG